MDVLVRRAAAADLPHALAVWRAANTARGRPPGSARIVRITEKLAAPDAIVLVAVTADKIIGMLQAEPARTDRGQGTPIVGLGHISMVFVDPRHWGHRVGQFLLDEVTTTASAQGYASLQLWTGTGNERAQRLYRRCGFVASGRHVTLGTGEVAVHFVRSLLPGRDTP